MNNKTAINPQALFNQALAFQQQGQLTEAEQLYQQLIAGWPLVAPPRHMLGILRMQQGRNEEALELIGGALKINPRDVDALANYGNALKGLGRLGEAVKSFDAALTIKPDFAGALYNRGLLLQELKHFEEALKSYNNALGLVPDFFEALYNRGILLLDMLRPEEGLAGLDKALAIKPNYAEAWNNRGNALRDLKRFEEALASYDRALAIRTDFANALYNRGCLLQNLNRLNGALATYDKALAAKPDFAAAWTNRGNALRALGRLPEALADYDKAIAAEPDFADAMKSRGQVLFESGRLEEGIAAFLATAERLYGDGTNSAPSSPHKLRHDREQQDYQAGIPRDTKAGARLAGRAVSSGNDAADEEWRTAKPKIVVIDNLLTPEALAQLRRFCLEKPVWRESYPNGYLGAFPEHGFACPLLGQIAEELRQAFPAIFRDHPLLYMWGFKYDSQLTGINIHADQAAVNVNFWITPDDANLDSEKGGLVIWDVAAPLDWDFGKFNGDGAAIRDFLAKGGARPTTVPYRANRAVIFDSDLFHETDTIRFKDGYLNRRINVTMLFGRRDSPSAD